MDEQEARDILGVDISASKKEINRSFKELTKNVHPDQGGSSGLFKKLQRAKQTLLDSKTTNLSGRNTPETDSHERDGDTGETNEFGAVPVRRVVGSFDISILAVFSNVDVSTLTYEQPSGTVDRTVVLWDVFNKSDQRAKWGNSGIEYILDDRLQVSPDIEYSITNSLGGPWEPGPQSLKIPEIGANARGRWVSLVDHRSSQQVVEAVLKGRQHPEVTLELPETVFVDPSRLPRK